MWSNTSWLSRSIHTGQMVQVMPENICTNPQQMLMLRMTLILTLEEDWISAPTCELLRSESSLSLKRWRNEIEMKVKVKTIQRENRFVNCFVVCMFKSKVQTGFVSFLKWPLDPAFVFSLRSDRLCLQKVLQSAIWRGGWTHLLQTTPNPPE